MTLKRVLTVQEQATGSNASTSGNDLPRQDNAETTISGTIFWTDDDNQHGHGSTQYKLVLKHMPDSVVYDFMQGCLFMKSDEPGSDSGPLHVAVTTDQAAAKFERLENESLTDFAARCPKGNCEVDAGGSSGAASLTFYREDTKLHEYCGAASEFAHARVILRGAEGSMVVRMPEPTASTSKDNAIPGQEEWESASDGSESDENGTIFEHGNVVRGNATITTSNGTRGRPVHVRTVGNTATGSSRQFSGFMSSKDAKKFWDN